MINNDWTQKDPKKCCCKQPEQKADGSNYLMVHSIGKTVQTAFCSDPLVTIYVSCKNNLETYQNVSSVNFVILTGEKNHSLFRTCIGLLK